VVARSTTRARSPREREFSGTFPSGPEILLTTAKFAACLP
jgi:hypothetical protein